MIEIRRPALRARCGTPCINQLRELKLDGMADAFAELQAQDRAKDLGHAEWLALLLDGEAASRNTKRAQARGG